MLQLLTKYGSYVTLRSPRHRSFPLKQTVLAKSRQWSHAPFIATMPKRKRSSMVNGDTPVASPTVVPNNVAGVASSIIAPAPIRRASTRKTIQPPPAAIDANPDTNEDVVDGKTALRASPEGADHDGMLNGDQMPTKKGRKAANGTLTPKTKVKPEPDESSLSELSDIEDPSAAQKGPVKKTAVSKKPAAKQNGDVDGADPEAEGDEDADPEEIKEALSRPPPVNSSYLPLPWKGRLGYACLSTYLRAATPPVFSSRTCRIASILEHRHPLKDPTQPEHATKNRPDKDQPADNARGQSYVEALALANVRDIPKMLRWNDKYGIKFFRLSSEMFPFASHDVYGYKLAPSPPRFLLRQAASLPSWATVSLPTLDNSPNSALHAKKSSQPQFATSSITVNCSIY